MEKREPLFNITPLKVGGFYWVLEEYKKWKYPYGTKMKDIPREAFTPVYIQTVEPRGDLKDPSSYSYGFTTTNNIPGMENSIHDCGGYLFHYSNAYRAGSIGFVKDNYLEMSPEEIVSFVETLRDKTLRNRYLYTLTT